jgi:hypothetical protein
MTNSPFPTFKSSPALQATMYYARKANRGIVSVVDVTALASGSIFFPANPSSGNTITIGGTVITFGTNVAIGASLAATLVSLLAYLKASADVNLVKNTYAISSNSLGVTGKTVGTVTTLASNFATVSAGTLAQPTIRKRKAL